MLLYRALVTLLAPFVVLAFLWRVLRRRETLADLGQRLGGGTGRPGAIWLHGASNGELTSARKLITSLAAAFPQKPVLVTANTTSGRNLVAGWGLENVTARLAPLDNAWATKRVWRAWRPALLIVLENELWPNRLRIADAPVLCIAARMSERSAQTWSKLPGLAQAVLDKITYLVPQDAASALRFLQLGMSPTKIGTAVTLKADVELTPPDPSTLDQMRAHFPPERTWLAASTHPGEDEVVLDALNIGPPDKKLILAPRHPARAYDIRTLAEARGLSVAQRSQGEPPDARVYIADTLGEMALWYSLAPVCYVGGSFVDIGGHTPFEPAAWGSAIIHGPFVSNFTAIYAALDQAGGAFEVQDASSLASAVARLSDPAQCAACTSAARHVIAQEQSQSVGVAQLMDTIARYL